MAAQIIMNLIIRGALLLANGLSSSGTIDLFNGNPYNGTQNPGMCKLEIYGKPTTPVTCRATVTCGTYLALYDFGGDACAVGQTFTTNDPNIGAFSISIQSGQSATSYPFPGELFIEADSYKEGNNNQMAVRDCVRISQNNFQATDCSGNDVLVKVCDEGFPDGQGHENPQDIDEYGWAYMIAFPDISGGKTPGCPTKKVKRSLSRFEIE